MFMCVVLKGVHLPRLETDSLGLMSIKGVICIPIFLGETWDLAPLGDFLLAFEIVKVLLIWDAELKLLF